jgi:hypothetical protein
MSFEGGHEDIEVGDVVKVTSDADKLRRNLYRNVAGHSIWLGAQMHVLAVHQFEHGGGLKKVYDIGGSVFTADLQVYAGAISWVRAGRTVEMRSINKFERRLLPEEFTDEQRHVEDTREENDKRHERRATRTRKSETDYANEQQRLTRRLDELERQEHNARVLEPRSVPNNTNQEDPERMQTYISEAAKGLPMNWMDASDDEDDPFLYADDHSDEKLVYNDKKKQSSKKNQDDDFELTARERALVEIRPKKKEKK